MKLLEKFDDTAGLLFGIAIAMGIMAIIGTAVVLSYFTETRVFSGRAPSRR